VTISSAASSNSQFALPGATFPVTISAGQSLQLNVAFTPQSAGTASGNLTLSSNASDSKASEAVAGTGTAPQVSLAWSPSTSQVEGYNVYRGTQAGSYSKVNAALDPNTSYTDTAVASGTTYYYAATAVNSSGQESTYSAPVKVAVP
jgi:fibronectin type 3 domain-containing protein